MNWLPPINLWTMPLQWSDYMHMGYMDETIQITDHAKAMIDAKPREFNHYYKDVSKLTSIDVYRVIELFSVTNPAIQHAVKKLLVAGGRGVKDQAKDVEEAIKSLQRWQEMRQEEA